MNVYNEFQGAQDGWDNSRMQIVTGGTRTKWCFDSHGGQATGSTRIPCCLLPSEDNS